MLMHRPRLAWTRASASYRAVLSTRAVGPACWSGMIVSDEHVELPPVPGDRIPPSPDPLPVVPAHHGLPDRRGQRGAD